MGWCGNGGVRRRKGEMGVELEGKGGNVLGDENGWYVWVSGVREVRVWGCMGGYIMKSRVIEVAGT